VALLEDRRTTSPIAARDLEQLLVFRNADDYLVSLDARTERSAGTSDPRSTSSISRLPRRSWSTTTCWWGPATISTCRDSPVVPRGHRRAQETSQADEARRSGARDCRASGGRHGGGQVWLPGVYDPETRLYIVGTGNPRRRNGCRTLATTSSPARSRSTPTRAAGVGISRSAHTRTPGFGADADSSTGRSTAVRASCSPPRRATATYTLTASRARTTSSHGTATNWAQGSGRPAVELNPEVQDPGLLSPVEGGVTNWPPRRFPEDRALHGTNGTPSIFV
jgi:hypothetical protein